MLVAQACEIYRIMNTTGPYASTGRSEKKDMNEVRPEVVMKVPHCGLQKPQLITLFD